MAKAYKLTLTPEDIDERVEYVIFEDEDGNEVNDEAIHEDPEMWFDMVLSDNLGYQLEEFEETDVARAREQRPWTVG